MVKYRVAAGANSLSIIPLADKDDYFTDADAAASLSR